MPLGIQRASRTRIASSLSVAMSPFLPLQRLCAFPAWICQHQNSQAGFVGWCCLLFFLVLCIVCVESMFSLFLIFYIDSAVSVSIGALFVLVFRCCVLSVQFSRCLFLGRSSGFVFFPHGFAKIKKLKLGFLVCLVCWFSGFFVLCVRKASFHYL